MHDINVVATNHKTKQTLSFTNLMEVQQQLGIDPALVLYMSAHPELNMLFDNTYSFTTTQPELAFEQQEDEDPHNDIMVIDYVNPCRVAMTGTREAAIRTGVSARMIRRCLERPSRANLNKYVGGYEFFYIKTLNLKAPALLNITPEQAVKDRQLYLKGRILRGVDADGDVPERLPKEADVLMYTTDDGEVRVEVQINGEDTWLSQQQMAKLFNTTKQNIGEHIGNIFRAKELLENSVVKFFFTTASDGKKYQVKHYNLDMIISVGYRVNSARAVKFRQWATRILKEYLHMGFAIDDVSLKYGRSSYFYELIERIRDIRSSEKHLNAKLLDVLKSSIDYDPDSQFAKQFFSVIQNKMHYATHGHTAAELVYDRIDATKPNLGMTHFVGTRPNRKEATVAKNYLSEYELYILNRITSVYLDFAELQAIEQRPMTMSDWVTKLDEFVAVTEREVLLNKGKISRDKAFEKAKRVYQDYIDAKLPDEFDEFASKMLKMAA